MYALDRLVVQKIPVDRLGRISIYIVSLLFGVAMSGFAAPGDTNKKIATDTAKGEMKAEAATPSHRESVLRMIEMETVRLNEAKPVEKTKEEKEKEAAEAAKKAARELAKVTAKNKMPPPPEKKSPNIVVEAIYGTFGEYKAKLNFDGQIINLSKGWRGKGYELVEIRANGITLVTVCPKGGTSCVPEIQFSPFPPPETKASLVFPAAAISRPQAVPGQVADLPPVPVPITNPQLNRR